MQQSWWCLNGAGCIVWSHSIFLGGSKCCACHLRCWAWSWCQELTGDMNMDVSASLPHTPELFHLTQETEICFCPQCFRTWPWWLAVGMAHSDADCPDLGVCLVFLTMANLTICQLTTITCHFWVLLVRSIPASPPVGTYGELHNTLLFRVLKHLQAALEAGKAGERKKSNN